MTEEEERRARIKAGVSRIKAELKELLRLTDEYERQEGFTISEEEAPTISEEEAPTMAK